MTPTTNLRLNRSVSRRTTGHRTKDPLKVYQELVSKDLQKKKDIGEFRDERGLKLSNNDG